MGHPIARHRLFFPVLLVLLWLASYFVMHVFAGEFLGWDEVEHLSVARGIVRDFDFSSRDYTIIGLIRQGFPAHLSYYPVFAAYIAAFMAVFGDTLRVAYFANWVAALAAALVIYALTLELIPGRRGIAFVTAVFWLLFPGNWMHMQSALMEQVGALLIALASFLFIRAYRRGTFTYRTLIMFSSMLALLWIFKTILIGFFFGTACFFITAFSPRISGRRIASKIPMPLFAAGAFAGCTALVFLAGRLLFYPLSPYFAYVPAQQSAQVYADFMGGFMNNFWHNLAANTWHAMTHLVLQEIIYPAQPTPYLTSFMVFVRYYFFVFFAALLLVATGWRRMSPEQRVFTALAAGSIIAFNIIVNSIMIEGPENIHRYNLNYLPLYLPLVAIALETNASYAHDFIADHPRIFCLLAVLLIAVLYIPLFLTMLVHQRVLQHRYNQLGVDTVAMIAQSVKDSRPAFIYFNKGTHAHFTLYPMRIVSEQATNEQLLQVNALLPHPIEFLFLKDNDWLYENNIKDIAAKKPILGGQYVYASPATLPGSDHTFVVYRHVEKKL